MFLSKHKEEYTLAQPSNIYTSLDILSYNHSEWAHDKTQKRLAGKSTKVAIRHHLFAIPSLLDLEE